MNNQIAAAQGTVLRQYDEDGDHRDYPIVGWWNLTGQLAQPLIPVPGILVGPGSLIIVPHNEWVSHIFCHPASGMAFIEEEAAAEFVGNYLTEHPLPKPAEKASPTAAKSNAPQSNPTAPLHFGAKVYATKSFWHWPDQNAVFEIEPNEPYPNDPRVKKVKRDEYAIFKRDGASKIDPHGGEVLDDADRNAKTGGDDPEVPDEVNVEDLV